HGYNQMILSMKASNPKVMIEAYRLLVERMQQEAMRYPLHLGVTEAGDGEDGRIKGAIGIGSLLLDGLGDTIRVSLTEDSVYEIPVAQALADKAMSLWHPDQTTAANAVSSDSIDPFHFAKRETTTLALADGCAVGPELPPRVIVRVSSVAALPEAAAQLASPRLKDTPVEGILVPIHSAADLSALQSATVALPTKFLVLELAPQLTANELAPLLSNVRGKIVLLRAFAEDSIDTLKSFLNLVGSRGHFLAVSTTAKKFPALANFLKQFGDGNVMISLAAENFSPKSNSSTHALGEYRALVEALNTAGIRAPIWIRNTAHTAVQPHNSFLSKLLEASILTGSLLCDGVGDLISIETEADLLRATKLSYNVLQGAGARISKTEFVACPSCGRTLFDLQTTTQRIREKTGHLKGVKLAIMGCIVNGPGEMADADFGYVGGAPGKINLYVGKTCVQYNIPQTDADDRLIALIKEHGKWFDPEPAVTD
ncbi:MAG TPA: flavodoxin-dependent (E)-4-hydroxy-3-methylbut-2-enyl-diphosphate synthase, partial [Opitutaceae bacterium]|nr:flavodoxin-dependent (E)-4-hydroxy-3-methylbut-2-enyl-diphosphate synthase [Opitutaceae bacterium]